MAEFTIYTKDNCPYCTSAKKKLRDWGHTYVERRVDLDEAVFKEVLERAPGSKTVPQIFINDYRIGGFDELMNLHREGGLDMTIDMAS